MDNNIVEWLGRNEVVTTNLEENLPDEHVVNNVETPKELPIKPSIWTLQEVLHFGYHPAKKLRTEELEVIFNEDRKYLVWTVVCAVLYFLDMFTDICLIFVFIAHWFQYYWHEDKLVMAAIVFAIILVPSLVSNLTNPTAIWRIKEYQTWTLWKRYIWWIGFPFYFIFHLEPFFQYYKNYVNLKSLISYRSGNRNFRCEGLIVDEPDQLLEEYAEGVFTIARLSWLQTTLRTVPLLLFYLFFIYTQQIRYIYLIEFMCVTSIIGIWLSNYKFTKSYFITRGRNLNNYFINAYSFCSAAITVLRVMLILDIMLCIMVLVIEHFMEDLQGWVKPAILVSFLLGHWIYEMIHWKLKGPEGFTGFMYTFYAGIYRTSVPDVSSFFRCIQTNIIMIIETGFFYTSARLTITSRNMARVLEFLVTLNHYLVGFLIFLHFTHIGLYYYYKKKIA